MNPLKDLPWTRIKLAVAKVFYRLIRVFLREDARQIVRGGIRYEADLSEAIDFTLFISGGFQSYVFDNPLLALPPAPVIVDVGANIGSMSLAFAKNFPDARIYAFEPTDRAFARLKKNIALNPFLSGRIFPRQAFLSDLSSPRHALTAYSSWKIDRTPRESHPLHGGTLQEAQGVPAFTLDDMARELGFKNLDLLKIDTEGHELSVLKGAVETLRRFRPAVIFELGLYTLKERGLAIEEYFSLLSPLGYHWTDLKSGKPVTLSNVETTVPARSTTDILAVCRPPR